MSLFGVPEKNEIIGIAEAVKFSPTELSEFVDNALARTSFNQGILSRLANAKVFYKNLREHIQETVIKDK